MSWTPKSDSDSNCFEISHDLKLFEHQSFKNKNTCNFVPLYLHQIVELLLLIIYKQKYFKIHSLDVSKEHL